MLLVLFAPAFLKYGGFADDPGVGWHLRTGEWVVQNGGAPTTDPFLAGPARAWVSDQWLSDALFWSVYDAGGWWALYALLTALFLFIFFAPVYRTASHASGALIAGAFAALTALKLSTIHFILRPVMVGFLFFAITFAICSRVAVKMGDDPEYAKTGMLKLLFVLPLIFGLWANFHPSFILGFILLGTLGLAFLLEPFFFGADSPPHRRAVGNVVGVGVFCFVATLLNPYGIGLHESIFSLMGSDFFARFNSEWFSPDFLEGSAQLALMAYVLIFGVRYLNQGGERMRLFEFGALLAFTIGYLRSVRLLPFLSIVLAVPVALAVRDLGRLEFVQRFELLAPVRRFLERAEAWESRSSRGAVGLLAVVVVLASGWLPVDKFGPTDRYPHAAIEHLRGLEGDVALYASPNAGGFITWAGGGEVRAIVDDRNTMLGEQIYRENQSVTWLEGDWLSLVRKSGATHLMTHVGSTTDHGCRSQLAVEYEDETFVVFRVE